MPAYIIQANLQSEITDEYLRQALDDNSDLVADTGLFTECEASAEVDVNAVLEAKAITLPLTTVPNVVISATRYKLLEKMWGRRGFNDKSNNPWITHAENAMKLLTEWANRFSDAATGADWGSDTKVDL